MTPMKQSVLPKGYVRISKPAAMGTTEEQTRRVLAAMPPTLYSRGGVLYVPDGGDRFARLAEESEVLRPGEVQSEGQNHVTKPGRVRVAELIIGISADFPRRLAVGDAGINPGTNVPLPPSDTATALGHEITRVDVTQRIINVDVPSITFVGLFKSAGSYQFNQPGQAVISEVGLYTTDEVLAAVYNFAPIPVDVHRLGVLVEWEWSIL